VCSHVSRSRCHHTLGHVETPIRKPKSQEVPIGRVPISRLPTVCHGKGAHGKGASNASFLGSGLWGNTGRYCQHVSGCGTSPGEVGRPNPQKCRSQKVRIIKCTSHSCRSEQTCRTSCSSTCRMLCHAARRFGPAWPLKPGKIVQITGI
jgi:hypothetical protein